MNIFEKSSHPPLILAPMAGVADNAFRILCKSYGADAVFSEMISAKAVYYGDKKTFALAHFEQIERPFILQIFGSEPQIMAYAAKTLADRFCPDGIDINMGCPVHKIFANNEGSALMKNPDLVYQIVCSVRQAVDIPVSVKIRTGIDQEHINALEVALMAQKGGADFITVHGRTRSQMYSGYADYNIIKEVKSAFDIPLIANGDVVCEKSLDSILATGCDGVMIGRGALGNPFIFERLKCHLEKKPYSPPSQDQIKSAIFKQLELCLEFKPESVAVREARKHISWYLKGFRGSAAMRDAVNRAESIQQIQEILK